VRELSQAMIDIHAHILPGIDDGPGEEEEALEILEDCEKQGITGLVATPHRLDYGRGTLREQEIREKTTRLNSLAAGAGLKLEIYPGTEHMLAPELVEAADREEVVTLADSAYLLVELPFSFLPPDSENLLYNLKLLGYQPIIAHPERCQEISGQPEILLDFLQEGAYAQLNAGSILGWYGPTIRETARILLESKLVQLMASDVHSLGKRSQGLPEALERVAELTPELGEIFQKNAEKILVDEELIRPEISSPAEQSGWQRKVRNIFDFFRD